ncbi:hypothetical protein BDN72DRAFT_943467 [Pluteus cervinus]|uniref:Uncharacterized protein n=1 Tax=Pluteus cervinus TaxID=181527 RepID=A0ACD3AX45_9AGAR|nr:hypothetical protein BDN72DRAFT_943467 [Pluteus cervinus]
MIRTPAGWKGQLTIVDRVTVFAQARSSFFPSAHCPPMFGHNKLKLKDHTSPNHGQLTSRELLLGIGLSRVYVQRRRYFEELENLDSLAQEPAQKLPDEFANQSRGFVSIGRPTRDTCYSISSTLATLKNRVKKPDNLLYEGTGKGWGDVPTRSVALTSVEKSQGTFYISNLLVLGHDAAGRLGHPTVIPYAFLMPYQCRTDHLAR